MIALRESGDLEALVRRHIASFASLAALHIMRVGGACGPDDLVVQAEITPAEAQMALDDLQAAGLIERVVHDCMPRFVLKAQPTVRAAVDVLLERYEEDRHFRTRLVFDILRRMSGALARA